MDPMANFLLLLVVIVTIVLAILALLNRITFKMAIRNFVRRKAHSAIVIAGLMVGTAIISSSLVVGDTFRFMIEVGTYRALGEIDEEIWGISQFGGAKYFDEDVYYYLSQNLSSEPDIESVAPAIGELVAVQNLDTELPEPRVALYGMDSDIMRSTVFGDLDDAGFYTDSLADGEAAINSRLADSLDAEVGHTLRVTYGAKNATNPYTLDLKIAELSVAKIIHELELYGKANTNSRAAIFLELDTAQDMFNREGEITHVWISNRGDYKEGEKYTGNVNGTIRETLDEILGMRDLGLILERGNGTLTLTSQWGYFSLEHAKTLKETAALENARTMEGVMIPTMSINSTSTNGMLVLGFESTDPMIPDAEDGIVYLTNQTALLFGISNGTSVTISALGLDGSVIDVDFYTVILPPGLEQALPEELQNAVLGFVNLETGQNLLHGGAYQDKLVSFVQVYGVDNATLSNIQTSTITQVDSEIGAEEVGLEMDDVKYNYLKVARDGGDAIATLFLIFSSFAIIAGMVLIINIFVMLGEERKSEMGMARAVGMKRKHLVRMFLFEGIVYAFFASAVGALLGLGLGRALIYAFSFVFSSADIGLDFPFYFEWDSVLTAFCAGFLLTFITIFFASRRISKLNIIRAIRRIPEPRGSRAMRKDLALGGIMLLLGILISYWAKVSLQGAGWMAGPPLLFLGLAVIAHKWVSIRAAITPAGFAIIGWILWPFENPIVEGADFSGFEIFLLSGVFLVLAGVIVVLFNSDLILLTLQKTVGKGKRTKAVLKTAISYPMDSKFKTGMSLGMFALIIFTVTVVAMITAMQTSLTDTLLKNETGGYDIIGVTNPRTPFENLTKEGLPPSLQSVEIEQLETISVAIVSIVDYDRTEGIESDYAVVIGEIRTEKYGLFGVSNDFLDNNGFTLDERDSYYSSDREAWQALAENSSLCIIDFGRLEGTAMGIGAEPSGAYVGGNVIISDLEGQNRTKTLKIIGITDQGTFLSGIFVHRDMAEMEYGAVPTTLLVELGPGEDADYASKEFEKNYLDNGLTALDLKAIISNFIKVQTNMMYLMEAFLGIGLLVGIAGIGIISYRNVIERRQQIGMLRAIGFRRKMITKSFLIETSFVTILAILIGLLLGIGIGWQVYAGEDGFREAGGSFVIPWMNLLAIIIIAYIATLIFTFYPSIKAAKVPPAEALRYIE
ncbi:MAG: ABC transporter permease [Methanomassiliicoccales archaeon]|nr:MAG: ABC transporter permease [Methanomassiliicoccales archaeon]